MVRAVPVDGCGHRDPINAHTFAHRIVYMRRGGCPLRDKVKMAVKHGAIGVVISDQDGRCTQEFSQACVPGSFKAKGQGFAKTDHPGTWRGAHVPALLVTKYVMCAINGQPVDPLHVVYSAVHACFRCLPGWPVVLPLGRAQPPLGSRGHAAFAGMPQHQTLSDLHDRHCCLEMRAHLLVVNVVCVGSCRESGDQLEEVVG